MSHARPGRLGYQWSRVLRHVRWARTEGIAKLVEEDQLQPIQRLRLAAARRRWRAEHDGTPGSARAVFLVGVQRSGTNMMARGLESCPAFEVRNENDRRAFDRFRLRFDALPGLVDRSRQGYVLFKPLCDSHLVVSMLDDLHAGGSPLALWAYRDVDGRVRSSVAKFGDANKRALEEIAATGLATARWEAGGLDQAAVELIRSLDPATLSAESCSALFWYLRNKLFFDLGLAERPDVLLTGYQEFGAHPQDSMRRLCRFLDLSYSDELVAHVDQRARSERAPLALDPRVRALCEELSDRLASVLAATGSRGG